MADDNGTDKGPAVGEQDLEAAEERGAEERDGEERDGEEAAEELTEIEQLQSALEDAKDEADEYLDGWRRAQAEFSNYKKRQRAEQAKIRELANANLLRKLLPVLDDFERAMATIPAAMAKLSWSQGLLMIKRKLEAILETEGVEPIDTEGEVFDPYCHEAVTHEEMPGYEGGDIIGEVQKGYVLGDRVLRPALVRVAKAAAAPPAEERENGDNEGEG